MLLSKFDLFSQPFLFNLNNNQLKKGTIQGFILSLGIIGTVFAYFTYLAFQFFDNKIDPIFRSQSFVTNQLIEIPLREDLVAFKFGVTTKMALPSFEKKMNKTYIVPIAIFGFQSPQAYNTTYLNITKCSNPDLEGYQCLDFSTLANKSLIQSSREKVFSVITILFYSCNVVDNIKTFTPDNCADQTDIDDLVNGAYTQLQLRHFTQQYNTTSKQNQVNYRNFMMFPQSDQYYLKTQKTQNQITKVKDGFIIQSEQEYNAPISYVQESQTFPNFENPYIQINVQIDEVIQYTSIQFSTFPQVLAYVNSTFSLLILLGFFCRKFASKSILQDFFCVFLQNMHQNLYEEILKQNKLFEQKTNYTQIETKQNQLTIGQEITEREALKTINVPCFITKSREYVEQSCQQIQQNTAKNYEMDEVQQSQENRTSQSLKQLKNSSILKLCQNSTQQIQNQQTSEENKFEKTSNENDLKQIRLSSNDPILINFGSKQFHPQKSKIKSSQNQMCIDNNKQNLKIVFQTERNIEINKNKNLSNSNSDQASNCKQNANNKIQKYIIKTEKDEDQKNKVPQKFENTIEYYAQKLKTIQNLEIFKKFTQINFGYWYFSIFFNNYLAISFQRFSIQKRLNYFKKKSVDIQNKKTLSLQQKQFIEQQVLKSMNIIDLLKDVIFIKKSIMILLTKDQLAAIKLVGYSENYIQDQNHTNQPGKQCKTLYRAHIQQQKLLFQEQLRKTTYFEKQLDILDSTDLSCHYIKKFIQKCQDSKTLNEVDKRILSSINKNQANS